jgi:hypothetical protein
MAEIHVERKGSRSWLWLLIGLAILLLLIAWLLWWRRDPTPDVLGGAVGGVVAGGMAGDTAGGTAAATGTGTAVANFLSYAQQGQARQAGPAHEYTAEGVRRLAAAIGELSQRNAGTTLNAELDAVRAQADSLQRNPSSTEHARYARESFRAAAALMRTVQQQHYPNAEDQVAQVRRAAEELRVDRPLLDQAANVQRFFDQSAAALRTMSGATT